MHRNRSAQTHQFAMIPSADIPRSRFVREHSLKTCFDPGYLIPIYVEEVLPGDQFNVGVTAFARMLTPIVPVMDNAYFDTFFFFVPNRLVWSNWKRFMGEQANPSDSISFTVPVVNGTLAGYPVGSLEDFMGLPVQAVPALGSGPWSHSALPLRAYNLIWNEWFRDENLQNSVTVNTGDGPETAGAYTLLRRGKRHDYFTSALPFVQKFTSVPLPLGTSAPVKTSASQAVAGAQVGMTWRDTTGATPSAGGLASSTGGVTVTASGSTPGSTQLYPSNLYADLSQATAATINQIRQAFQIQKLLERDARGGTRYTEIVRSHFGVISPDARLQRPEYLGGGSAPIIFSEIPQTSATGAVGTPQGNLAAQAKGVHRAGFSQSFTEHGYIIGLANIRTDLTYQQGVHKHWKRSTRYDFYFPVFAALGEQPVLNGEIYYSGNNATDQAVFGYQERWAEYRYGRSQITSWMRSQSATPLDVWHFAQEFTTTPVLNDSFIRDEASYAGISRASAVTGQAQTLFKVDMLFSEKVARPMPMYSVPGLIDHF